ncbi:YbaK/EbsC family protein [Acinetobacter larvae]|uniref:YbaK/aminoacyl-tRNA synthetase-associated domain-containing protein n=1 Tax=Acinetobacter larvae TaxID=1789224 RepID=A0A1B2M1I5_9GAMM|nr:YbaK/EbsC family protein [Acinetobacter larvae]AOA59057.1 hypothetical protein BFG52_12320 [Acinetobacter larvae]
MTEKLKSSAQRVQDCLTQAGYDFRVKQLLASTRTAEDAAHAIGCEVAQIAKSLIFKDKNTGDAVLIVAAGHHQVDLKKIKATTPFHLSKADADFVRDKTGFAIGGVSPIAHRHPLHILLDEDLKNYASIWAAAGTPNAVFELNAEILAQLTQGQWLSIH